MIFRRAFVAAALTASTFAMLPVQSDAAAQPTICQAKAAYLQFLITSRRQGINESELVDYDRQIDAQWKSAARRRVYDDADLMTQDLGQTIYKFYSGCIADSSSQNKGSKNLVTPTK